MLKTVKTINENGTQASQRVSCRTSLAEEVRSWGIARKTLQCVL
jgi:hypothetical protein